MFVIGPGPDGGASKLKELRAQMPENSGVAAEASASAGMAIAVAISAVNLRPAIMVYSSPGKSSQSAFRGDAQRAIKLWIIADPVYRQHITYTRPLPAMPGDRERRSVEGQQRSILMTALTALPDTGHSSWAYNPSPLW